MKSTFMRRAGIACLAFAAVVMVVLMSPVARLAAYSGTLDACVNPGNGMMRLVDSSAACHANETFVEWNITGPAGPAGPQGPQGPPGTSPSGAPFNWVCAPASIFALGNSAAFVYIFNGSGSTANVTTHFLNINGANLMGHPIPGTSPAVNYPGQAGTDTVPISDQNTMIISYQTASGDPSTGGDQLITVTVRSDQPVAVSVNPGFDGPHPMPCSLLPK